MFIPAVAFYKLVPMQFEADNSISIPGHPSLSEQFAAMTLQEQLITFFMIFAAAMAVEGVDRLMNRFSSSHDDAEISEEVEKVEAVEAVEAVDPLQMKIGEIVAVINDSDDRFRRLSSAIFSVNQQLQQYPYLRLYNNQMNSGVSAQALQLMRRAVMQSLADAYRHNVGLSQNPIRAHQLFFQNPVFQTYQMPLALMPGEDSNEFLNEAPDDHKYDGESNNSGYVTTPSSSLSSSFPSSALSDVAPAKSNWVRNSILIGAGLGLVAAIALTVFFPPSLVFTAGLMHLSLGTMASTLGVGTIMGLFSFVGASVGGLIGLSSSSTKAAPALPPVVAEAEVNAVPFNHSYAQLHGHGLDISHVLDEGSSNNNNSNDNNAMQIEVLDGEEEALDLSHAATQQDHFSNPNPR